MAIGAVALLLIIAITATATYFIRSGGTADAATGDSSPTVASAGDNGPVTVITYEPTCDGFNPINDALYGVQNSGWADMRKDLGPRAQWTPSQVTQVQAVTTAWRTAADQLVPLAIQTPHRWVRELYEQMIVYYRAYADIVPNYTPADDALASAAVNGSTVVIRLCQAISELSATRAVTTLPVPAPATTAPLGDPTKPQRAVTTSDPLCAPWAANSDTFNAATVDWQKLDISIPAAQRTPEQTALNQTGLAAVSTWAGQMKDVAARTTNPVLQDFAYSAALYLATFLTTTDTYVEADSWLLKTSYGLNQVILAACRSVSE